MFQTLNGRIKWKHTARGVFITIPVRRGAMTHLYGPLVGLWLIAVAFRYRNLLNSPHIHDTEFTIELITIGIYIVGLIFAVCWLVWIFTSETGILINAREMKIQRMVLFIEMATRTFETPNVLGLKFIPPKSTWASMGHLDPRTSRIQFQAQERTHTLAMGVSQHEAAALFYAMQRVYRFPDHPNLNIVTYQL
jgi:hypothetical protein